MAIANGATIMARLERAAKAAVTDQRACETHPGPQRGDDGRAGGPRFQIKRGRHDGD